VTHSVEGWSMGSKMAVAMAGLTEEAGEPEVAWTEVPPAAPEVRS
jgi:hypothetical protein